VGKKFEMFSGYLNLTHTKKQLHYVAVTSQNNVTTDPVILWFNGGSGCSSLVGYMLEHGPYTISEGSVFLIENVYSWNRNATVVYIESPAGVGFSICDEESECLFNDTN
jgi:carboxypeptidase C (cathepsin A)